MPPLDSFADMTRISTRDARSAFVANCIGYVVLLVSFSPLFLLYTHRLGPLHSPLPDSANFPHLALVHLLLCWHYLCIILCTLR
ncbi:hypothetical protein BD626DRAFT_29947 [Schizophyllum amplum]|uniref:Uncharacterized protein n=1 Tax=Schizophyllum amplum TaxID=97359 RepID=A0A550D0G3_9AGAR|nr:hypothetical protein BD626DRAFT_29947 [Auriculariopsis ampla]